MRALTQSHTDTPIHTAFVAMCRFYGSGMTFTSILLIVKIKNNLLIKTPKKNESKDTFGKREENGKYKLIHTNLPIIMESKLTVVTAPYVAKEWSTSQNWHTLQNG